MEQRTRLPKLYDFYSNELLEHQIYPGSIIPQPYQHANFAALLPEPGNYLFKNVERRQRLKDQKEYNPQTEKKKEGDRLFDTQFIESVRLKHADISQMDRSFQPFSETFNDSSLLAYSEAANQLKASVKQMRKSNIEDLVDEFIQADSCLATSTREKRISEVSLDDTSVIFKPGAEKIRLTTEDNDQLAEQYESIFDDKSRITFNSDLSKRSIRISAIIQDNHQPTIQVETEIDKPKLQMNLDKIPIKILEQVNGKSKSKLQGQVGKIVN